MFPIITIVAKVPPIKYVRESPPKIFAGHLFNKKKPIKEPNADIDITDAIVRLFSVVNINKEENITTPIPLSIPLNPPNKLIAFAAPTTPIGIIIKGYIKPKLICPIIGKFIDETPAFIIIKGKNSFII